jgi:hypothetical protein
VTRKVVCSVVDVVEGVWVGCVSGVTPCHPVPLPANRKKAGVALRQGSQSERRELVACGPWNQVEQAVGARLYVSVRRVQNIG